MTFDAKGYMANWAGFREMNTRAWDDRRAVNSNCNGSGPHTPGEVRLMPHSDTPLHGNDILCRSCWQRALTDRRERNRDLGDFARYSLPAWETGEVYETEPTNKVFYVEGFGEVGEANLYAFVPFHGSQLPAYLEVNETSEGRFTNPTSDKKPERITRVR